MSAQTRMETAMVTIRNHTRSTVVASMAHLLSQFHSLGLSITKKFSGSEPLTEAQQKKMNTAVVAGLKKIALNALATTNDDTSTTVTAVSSTLLHAHQTAAEDEGVDPDGLDERFDGLEGSTFNRIDKGHGRRKTLPVLFNQYRDAAVAAIAVLLAHAVSGDVTEKDVAKDVAALLEGKDISYGKYGVSREQTTGLRNFLPASQRIDMSETFNTMREATAAGMDAGGFVLAAQWTLSPHHTVVDVCDEIALDDVGLGKGMYLVSDWPLAPHPHCACSMGSPIKFKPQDQW